MRALGSIRLVLALKPADGAVAGARLVRMPRMSRQDRMASLEARTVRIEARLLVLEEDTARWVDAADGNVRAGLPLRRRSLEFTRQMLVAHLDNAARLCGRSPAIEALRSSLASGDAPRLDKPFLAGAPVDLERIADSLLLYHEVRERLSFGEKLEQEEGAA